METSQTSAMCKNVRKQFTLCVLTIQGRAGGEITQENPRQLYLLVYRYKANK